VDNLLEQGHIAVDADALFRALGYPDREHVSAPVQEICLDQLGRLDQFLRPWAGVHEVRVEEVTADTVRLDCGRTLSGRRLATILRRATSLQICLATVGAEVMEEIKHLVAEGAMLEALALDAGASAAVTRVMAAVRERVCNNAQARGFGTTIRYGPGYTGWQLEDTAVLFSYLGRHRLPVRLNEQFMMLPAKSLLNVIGLVPGGTAQAPEVVPCRMCDLEHCSVRQLPHDRARHPAEPGERNANNEA